MYAAAFLNFWSSFVVHPPQSAAELLCIERGGRVEHASIIIARNRYNYSDMQSFRPMLAARAKEPFDHEDWLFEVKYNGFRALAYLDEGRCRLVSRRNHVYKSFQKLSAWLGENVQVLDAVIDGELVCLGHDGKPLFNQLLYRRGDPYFMAFDLLSLNGEDLRKEPLIERKRLLKEITPRRRPAAVRRPSGRIV
jgi:bifunctional non-homologous end joining protein LigD